LSVNKELRQFSKNGLIQIIISQGDRIKRLESIIKQYENHNTPSSQKRFKKNTKDKEAQAKDRFPGREKGHEGAGIKLPEADKTEEHRINKKGYKIIGKRVRTVIDLADNPIVVTKHIIYKYRAPDGAIVEPEVDLPEGIYGKNIQAFNCLLKGKLGASHEGIADLVKAIRQDISFCAATSQKITDTMANALTPIRKSILEEVRNAFYCNADETGLRQDGLNGYVWFFGTLTHALYETDLSRSGNVPKRVLGEDYDNIIVVDGWQGYNGYKKQRCWVHLMRELNMLAEENEEVKLQADYFHNLYKKALEAKTKPPDERISFVEKMNGKAEFGYMIEALSKIKCCQSFVTTLENARPCLFTGVIYPEVPLDNNHAERMLRKIVVHRKLMGCIRNEKGQKFIENVMSVMQTWHLQRKNIYQNLKNFAS